MFSPSIKFEMKTESPFDRLESSAKLRYGYPSLNRDSIQGKKINFNNIDLSNTHNTNINININYKITNNSNISEKSLNSNTSNIPQSPNKISCTCTKTNCKKKYCACFASGRYCENCQCENCENKKVNNLNGVVAINGSFPHGNIICNCTKSNCKKKYCECYKGGKECSWLCRCVNCENCAKRKINCDDYIIEGIGIEISNNIMSIKRRIILDNREIKDTLIGFEDPQIKEDVFTPMKMSNKKRHRAIKTESTNFKTANVDSSAKRFGLSSNDTKKKKKMLPKGKKLNI